MTDATSLTTPHPDSKTAGAPPAFRWSPILAIALSTFTVVTSEMMPIGLLTPVSAGLGVSPGLAGTSLTITGIVAALTSPLTPALIGLRDRRTVLAAFMVLLVLANMLSAAAPSFAVLAVARALLGVSMGVVWGLAGGLGARLSDERHLPRVMTVIFSGVSIASVLGIPLGTSIANLWGWRAAFVGLGLLGLVATAVILTTMPKLPVDQRSTLRGLFGTLRNRGVAAGMAITALAVIGHFTGYTYVRPVLEAAPGMTASLLVVALALYGVAGVVGNFTLGSFAARRPRAALMVVLAGITAAAALLPTTTSNATTAMTTLILWGVSYGAVSVATQAWTRVADPGQVERTSALWAGVFNASIAAGALLGGTVIDNGGTSTVLRTAAVVAFAAWLIAATFRLRAPRK
ncbi:MFS transporter [Streptomyces sp. NPDC056930]|uniref:MFS transporter n=1 Tax=Streptomyces sp. NPDC056930 TaxID=3345967 RepID=UPI0036448C5B